MGQVRGLLRGIGYSSGGSPAEVLTELDRAIEGLALDTMATALVARLEQDDDDLRGRPGPAALVQRRSPAAGRARPRRHGAVLLDDEPPELLLGRRPGDQAARARHASSSRGSTVLLYTDGLVERRDRDLDAGTAELLEVLRGCADCRWTSCATRCSSGSSCPTPQDDVALLALRLHPQDGRVRRRRVRRHPDRIEPAPACSPGRLRGLSQGRPPPADEPVAGPGRQVDGDRRLPAAPHRQHAQAGHQHDHQRRDRQRVEPERSGEDGERGGADQGGDGVVRAPAGRCRRAGRAGRRG